MLSSNTKTILLFFVSEVQRVIGFDTVLVISFTLAVNS